MKNGLAVVSKILLGVFVIFIGFVGYTGYSYFTDKDFNFYGLMPRVVEEAVDTEVADESAVDEEVEDESAGTANAEDASRQADLNNIIVTVETYASDNGEYPRGTGCVDEMEELKMYFKDGELPSDDAGEQVFESEDGEVSISCPGGYLYQDFGDGEYLVWAKADDDASGNSEYFFTDKAEAVKGESGVYIFHGSIGDLAWSEAEKDGNPLTNLFSGSESDARDAGKKADVNNLIMAIETYNNDYMGYPQKTACVDAMDELDEYLITGDRIFEDGGKVTFETEDGSVSITCEGGHLYQSFGNGYVFWTTMESEKNGNMQYFVTNQGDVVKGDVGKYYIYPSVFADPVEMLPFEGGDVAPVETTGVSRGVSRTAN